MASETWFLCIVTGESLPESVMNQIGIELKRDLMNHVESIMEISSDTQYTKYTE